MITYLKRFAGTVIALVIFLILLGSVLLFNRDKQTENNLEKVFPGIKSEEITSIDIKSAGSEFSLKKNDSGWLLKSGSKQLKADTGAVENLIRDIKEMEVEKFVSRESNNLNEYGIVESESEFSFHTKDKEYPVIVGDKSPVGSGIYIYDLGEGRVLIVKDRYLWGFLDKKPGDFRERKLLALDKDKVTGISVKVGNLNMELARKGGKWLEVTDNSSHLVDQKKVGVLLDSFSELKAEGFEDGEPADLNKYGLLDPTAEIVFYSEGREEGVVFGKRKDEVNYYIKLRYEAPVFSVSKDYFKILPKNSEEFLIR